MNAIRPPAVPLVQDFLSDSARRHPDREALVCQGQRVTYGELEARSNALAAHLAAAGVARGDRVMAYADNSVETVVSFWAALKADAVITIVNPLTKPDKLRYLLRDCRPAAVVTEAHLQRNWLEPVAQAQSLRTVVVAGGALPADLPHAIAWSDALAAGMQAGTLPARRNIDADLAAIIYTSGSTGDAKGVMLTHRNMLTACASIVSVLDFQPDEVVLSVLPLAFNYGLYQMIMTLRMGGRLVLERSFAFPAQVLNLMVQEKVTGFPGVPTIFAILAEFKGLAEYDLSSVRFITNTAANLPVKHIDLFQRLLPQARIYSMYGLTECKRCTYLPPQDIRRKPTSVGVAIPNTELWLVDEHDQRVTCPGVPGQVVIRGNTVMRGYWEKPEATAKALRPGPLPGEWVFYTGDLCQYDEDGYLYFVSRMDDIIKSRGEKVPPKEVEHALQNIPGVRESAVIGVPDEVLGQAIKAFVVLEEGVTLSERQLHRECMERLESYMVPKFFVFVPDLPRTDTGKITKRGLA